MTMATTTNDNSSGPKSDPAPPSSFMNSRRIPSTTAIDSSDGENSTNSNSQSPCNDDDDATKANHESTNGSTHPTPSDEKKDDRDEPQSSPTDELPTTASNVRTTLSIRHPSSPPKNKRPFLKQMDSYKMNIDESPFEHGFQPGDHVIRWDMLPILWPIQIHGIVLEVSDDRTTVTICDFGITTVKEDKKGEGAAVTAANGGFTKNEETILAEAIRKLDAALDGPSSGSEESSDSEEDVEPPPYSLSQDEEDGDKDDVTNQKKAKSNNRLNVITLTKWSDLRKWQKVNYEGGFGSGGVGKGLKKLGNTTGKLWSSMTKTFAKGSQEHLPTEELENKVPASEGLEMAPLEKTNGEVVDAALAAEANAEINEERLAGTEPKPEGDGESKSATITTEAKNDGENEKDETLSTTETKMEEVDAKVPSSPSKGDKIQPPSKLQSPRKICGRGTMKESSNEKLEDAKAEVENNEDPALSESKTLAEMIAEANEIERRSRKVVVAKTAPPSPEKKPVVEKKDSWYGSLTKSFSSMLSQREEKESSSRKEGGENKSPLEEGKQNPIKSLDNLPKSDPQALVLARTRFLLEQGEDVLPPYHIINSNSECIAVWCKTGRWSTLQAAVFLHSTAIGNAKSSTALTLTVAAVQPWLIPVMAGAGIAAVGTPWLFLKLANDKWNEATMSLTDKFWMQAEPEVFVECIEKWSRIK
mmetsp:Transcript_10559/g.21968  ORF Transcript_10559/g.21968 Transcript_10559/m.21968 type:complete len:701 (-) Transcript_10559:85-2187(-)